MRFRLDAIALLVAAAVVAGCTSTESDRQGATPDSVVDARDGVPDTVAQARDGQRDAEAPDGDGEQAPGDAGETPADPAGDARDRPAAPWREDRLSASEVPAVYLEAWRQAENRATCAVIAPDSLGRGEGASVRRAQFGGGWGVAYDLRETRSAFGVAGTGVADTSGTYDEWPFTRRWADGSYAEYGPEGGGGQNELAYLRIAGQDCLYNVWSRLGVEHLEFLLEHLRYVETG